MSRPTKATIAAKAAELVQLKRQKEAIEDAIEALEASIKAYMGDKPEVTCGEYRIAWTPYMDTRIDTKALKADLPDIAAQYTRSKSCRRFSIA